jgi:hypothetical protein
MTLALTRPLPQERGRLLSRVESTPVIGVFQHPQLFGGSGRTAYPDTAVGAYGPPGSA